MTTNLEKKESLLKPRGKNKHRKDLGLRQWYKFYCENYKDPVSYELFKKILFNEGEKTKETYLRGIVFDIRKAIVEKAYTFKFFYKLGYLRIKKKKPYIKFNEDGSIDFIKSSIPINYKETLEYWRTNPKAREKKLKIYHDNFHTRGFKLSFSWEKYYCTVKNNACYCFTPVRDFSRQPKKALVEKGHKIDYFE